MKRDYEVIVIGAGASGGTAASHLARAGVDVLVLEGGPRIQTQTDFNTHGLPFEYPRRVIPIMRPGKPGFDSPRSCGVGGKTLLWNAVALRYSQRDFKGATREDAGMDWPIDYADMAPYYSKVEREVGLCGQRDGLEDLPDGEFLPPAPLKCSDEILQRGAARLGIKLIHVRKATLTRFTNGRPACHYCGNCMAGCDIVAKYNSADVQLYPAERETGKLEIRENSIVYELAVDNESRVSEVKFFDRESGERAAVRGRKVIMACSCEQSVGLLLMSKSSRFPNGLGNNSQQVGKHFIPHVVCQIEGFLKELIGKSTGNDEGFLDHAYIPSFMHDRQRDYPRSFGIQLGYHNRRRAMWARQVRGMGASFKQAVRERYPAFMEVAGYMEMLPNSESFIDLDPVETDQYGLPRTRARWHLTDSDWKRWRDMRRWCIKIMEESGAELLRDDEKPLGNHALGGCRMGANARTSVVDAHCRVHEVLNLYIVDGSVFPSASEKNPTLTMMALAARVADHIAQEFKRGGAQS